MKKSLMMSFVAIVIACVGVAVAAISFVGRKKCCCDECDYDNYFNDDFEFFDDYDESSCDELIDSNNKDDKKTFNDKLDDDEERNIS